jgi:hypothetical protein
MKKLFAFLFATVSLFAAQYTPPAERVVDWEANVTTGVYGGIQTTYGTTITITDAPYSADSTGVVAIDTAIWDAVIAAKAIATSSHVVRIYFPAGTYKLDNTIALDQNSDYIVIEGAGIGITTINAVGGTVGSPISGINLGPSYDAGTVTSTTGTRTRGVTSLTLASATGFVVGRVMQVYINDQVDEPSIESGAVPVVGQVPGMNQRGQIMEITGVVGNVVSFRPPLAFDATGFTTSVWSPSYTIQGSGLMNFTLNCENGHVSKGIYVQTATNCFIKNVKVYKAVSVGTWLDVVAMFEVNGCYMDQQKTVGGPNGAGYMVHYAGGLLVENNIVIRYFPAIEVNNQTTYSVFAYNYLEDSRANGDTIIGNTIDTNHEAHNSYNLYEGNIAPVLQADGFYGSVSEDYIFRNFLTGRTLMDAGLERAPILLNRFTRNYTIVGNVLRTTGTVATTPYIFGLPNMGNDVSFTGTAQPSLGTYWAEWATYVASAPGTSGVGPSDSRFQEKDLDVEDTTILKANRNAYDDAIPAGESLSGDTLPNSMFRDSKPSYFGSLAWPPFDSSTSSLTYNTTTAQKIPAGYWYTNGNQDYLTGTTMTAVNTTATNVILP